jgi:RNA polymerase sigma-70 factor (ECF subfamily)
LLDLIIEGCRKGQRESQKELYQMFYTYGMSITMRYADSREKASQVLNDSFMKVFTNIKKYDRHRPFKPWLRQIIVNTAINHVHKEERQKRLENFDDYRDELSSDQTIISGLSYQEIIDMIQKLTPAYRTVFNLYVIDGFKHHEIAEMLDISVGTSKSNLYKAKRNLRTMLENNLMK